MCILPFFWSTKTVILDNDELFIEEIKELLGAKSEQFIFFTDPVTALEYINNQKINSDCFITVEKQFDSETIYFNTNFNLIKDIILDSNRYDIISNIIVDYHMPVMTGIEFCLKIKNKSIPKTLLTASMHQDDIINNFNENTINGFIDKKNIIKYNYLENYIAHTNKKYFQTKASFIVNAITASYSAHPILFSEYNEIIKEIIINHKIKEYYLLNYSGSFIMIDTNSVFHYLFLFTKEEVDEFAAETLVNNAGINASLALYSYKKALCYYDETNPLSWPSDENWEKFLQPVKEFNINNNKYYYALVEKNRCS